MGSCLQNYGAHACLSRLMPAKLRHARSNATLVSTATPSSHTCKTGDREVGALPGRSGDAHLATDLLTGVLGVHNLLNHLAQVARWASTKDAALLQGEDEDNGDGQLDEARVAQRGTKRGQRAGAHPDNCHERSGTRPAVWSIIAGVARSKDALRIVAVRCALDVARAIFGVGEKERPKGALALLYLRLQPAAHG